LHRQKALATSVEGMTEGVQYSSFEEEKLRQAFKEGVDEALEDFDSLGGNSTISAEGDPQQDEDC